MFKANEQHPMYFPACARLPPVKDEDRADLQNIQHYNRTFMKDDKIVVVYEQYLLQGTHSHRNKQQPFFAVGSWAV